MGNLLKYSGIVTKIRCMEAKLLTPAQFEEIACLRNVMELVSYLKEHTAYATILNQLDEAKMHRGDIEKILIQSLYEDYSKIYKFCNLEQRKFLKLYLRHYEVDLINYCLRIVFNHYQEPFDLNYKKPFFDHYSNISIDKLMASRTVEQLVENLRGTVYYAPLHSLLKSRPTVTLFDFDLTLNLFCYADVWKSRMRILSRKEKESFVNEWGAKIDLLNLQWIYRAKTYYQMRPEEIYAIIVPIHHKIPTDKFKGIVEGATVEDFIAAVHQTPYAKGYDAECPEPFDRMYHEVLSRLFCISRRKDPYSVTTIESYLFLKEEELDQLTSAMERIRYGFGGKTK